MNSQHSFNIPHRSRMKSIVLAVALALPGTAALSESIDVVRAGGDQNGDQRYGRDSVYVPQPFGLFPPKEAQMYGRAGGYVGSDRVVALEATPSHSSDVVKAGDSGITNVAAARSYEGQRTQTSSEVNSSMLGAQDTGRTSGERFDNSDSAHGQHETGTQVQ